MSLPNQRPAYFRYLKARLQPFGRPAFWVSSLGFLLILLFAWEYWTKPEWFGALQDDPFGGLFAPPEPTLSSEELAAISADIDSSAVLIEEFDRARALALTNSLEDASENSNLESSLTNIAPLASQPDGTQVSTPSIATETSEPKPTSSNPFAKSAQDFLTADLLAGTNLFGSLSPVTTPSSSSPTSSSSGVNLLNLSTPNEETEATSPSQNSVTGTPGTNSLGTNNQSTGNQAQTPTPTQSQTSPIYPTSGQMMPPPPTLPRATNYTGTGSFLPPTVPGGSGYNAAGQPIYAPAPPVPGGSGFNAAGQPIYAPAPAYPTVPMAPMNPGNVGQYSTQPPTVTNGFPSGVNPTPITPGLQPSQLNRSNLNR